MQDYPLFLVLILFASVIIYQFLPRGTTEKFSNFLSGSKRKSFVAHLTGHNSDKFSLLSTGFSRKTLSEGSDVVYHVEANLPVSQGGDYINSSIIYTAFLDDKELGTLARHSDGVYKLTKTAKDGDKMTIKAQLFADAKPVESYKLISGNFK